MTRRTRARPGRRAGRDDVAAFEEAYQVLRAGVSAALADIKQPRIMVTSPAAGDGKTITCVNLALCFARTGQRVVLVDFDLRHPGAHQLIGAHNDFGLTDLLTGARPAEECLQSVDVPGRDTRRGGLYFLGTGPVVDNPAELLSLDRTPQILDIIAEQADVVVIDTPPLLSVADALVTGRMVSGALVVVQARRTTLPEVGRAKELLLRNQTRLLGIVLNKFDPRDHGYWEAPAVPPVS